MDPITGLQLAAQRQATFEHRAAERRLARTIRSKRSWTVPTRRPRPAAVTAPLSCCPA